MIKKLKSKLKGFSESHLTESSPASSKSYDTLKTR